VAQAWKFLIFILALAGCVMIGGKYADWYAMKKINDYFDLSEEQGDYLRPRVKDHVDWLKKHELQRIRKELDQLVVKVEKGNLTDEDLIWFENKLLDCRRNIYQRLKDDALWLLTNLSNEQHKHLAEEIADSNNRWQKNLKKSPDEYREDRLERYEENFEDWFGSITEEQRSWLKENFSSFAELSAGQAYFDGRLEAQQNLLNVLKPPADKAAIEAFIEKWVEDPSATRPVKARAAYLARITKMRSSILKIDKMITSEQRRHFIKKIRSYQEDMASFAG
jgi:hypothetical protein